MGTETINQQSQFFPKSAYRTLHGDEDYRIRQVLLEIILSKDFESFKIFELRFKYFVLKRLELNVFLPLVIINQKQMMSISLILDLVIYHLTLVIMLYTPKADRRIRYKLILGAGIKLPTGNYYAHDAFSDRLPFEMQPGTGSTDGFVIYKLCRA
jgi:hypothetical protein